MSFWQEVDTRILAIIGTVAGAAQRSAPARRSLIDLWELLGQSRHALHVGLADPPEETQRSIWSALDTLVDDPVVAEVRLTPTTGPRGVA